MMFGGRETLTNKDKQEGIIKKINPFLFQKQEILMAYLYGSYAKGTPHSRSDIDVAIYLKNRVDDNKYPYGYRAEIITSLIKLLGTNKIDLIILNDVPGFSEVSGDPLWNSHIYTV